MKRKLSLIVLVAMLAVVCFGVLAACQGNGLSDYDITTLTEKVKDQIANAQGKTSYTLSDVVSYEDVYGKEISCNVKWESDDVTITNGSVTVPAGITAYILKATLVGDNGKEYKTITQAVSVNSGNQGNQGNQGNNPNQGDNPNPNPNPTPSGEKGTQGNPYTVAEALAIIDGLAQGGYSASAVYTTGIVSNYSLGSSGQHKCDINDAGSSSKLTVYYADLGSGVTSFKNGDTIVVYGYLMHFYNSKTSTKTPEVASNNNVTPTVVSVVEGSGSGSEVIDGTATFDLSGKGASGNGVEFTTLTQGSITVTASKGSGTVTPKYFAADLRLYGGNTLTVAAADGKAIKSITFTYNSQYDGTLSITVDGGTFSANSWTGSASSVTFSIATGSGNRRLTSITIVYE